MGLLQTNGKPLYFADKNLGTADKTKSGYYFGWGAVEPLHTTKVKLENGDITTGWNTWADISATEKTKYSFTNTDFFQAVMAGRTLHIRQRS